MFSFISFYDSTARQNVNIVHELKWININNRQSIRLDHYTLAVCEIRNLTLSTAVKMGQLVSVRPLNMGIMFRNFIKSLFLRHFLWLVYYVDAACACEAGVCELACVCVFVVVSTAICYHFKIDVKCHYEPCPVWFTILNIKPVFLWMKVTSLLRIAKKRF